MTLVITLAALGLGMLLVLGLLQLVFQQIHSGQSNPATAQEKMLADSAAALVMGQIEQASTQTGVTWISQPGLLRTYGASASRAPLACYKLYSSAQMIDVTGTLAFLTSEVPADWNSSANRNAYTDLNTPVQTSSFFGQVIYPILGPAALTSVEGVSIDVGHGTEMPVAWLYQFQDGTFGPASNGTKDNPIVARVAFWTDDESSKININTAGCGPGWNSPHANSSDDVTWSTRQPAIGEFSSYPGHPATTSLAPVFSALTPQQLLALTPRYGWGGSRFGTQTTMAGEKVSAKTDRLYGSLDELLFSSSLTNSGQRDMNPISTSQLNAARFVLTAHSQSPETTMLGEPRFAIWPVSDSAQDPTRTTATDRAVETAATVGTRDYFFQRHDASSATNDLSISSNTQFFNDLVSRGGTSLPGWGTAFSTKYTGATWTQLMLEITDFIRGTNAVDPSASPFVAYASGDSSGIGRGLIVPLTTNYGAGPSKTALRGLGRCPTLSSLTLVIYVCGFGFADGTVIDYDATPDLDGTNSTIGWKKNFAVNSSTQRWKNVTSELVRAFFVPCTFQPGCGYPEVSDACDIQISGLNGITVSSGSASGDFGFAATSNSRLLSDALTVAPTERSWGGNEGPLAWRAGALDAANPAVSYPFAGTKAFAIPLDPAATVDTVTGGPSLPDSWKRALNFNGVTGLVVRIRDRKANALQTLNVDLPAFSVHSPTINGECDHADGTTAGASNPAWATSASCQVAPSYYMNLRNRLEATQLSRAEFIQAGDITRSVEAGTDLRIIAALSNVPSTLFHPHPSYTLNTVNAQGGSHAQNIRFADGTSACFASGNTQLINATYASVTGSMTAVDWRDGSSVFYTSTASPSCSAPTGTKYVTMLPTQNIFGDWDTGPGLAADGAQIALPESGTTLAPATAYFSLSGGQVGAATQRAPNALVPSPVVFGSLPAGINPTQPAQSEPWRTLLFCPYPAGDSTHPGFSSPPDYLVLDNFWMPTVEPYAISTCMTTAGKINLNDQIAPFTWIHRNTALHALLADLRIPAIPASMIKTYKSTGTPITSIWKTVDENATIAQIENRFANNSADAYLSESEICSVPIVPQGQAAASVSSTRTALDSFWNSSLGAGRLTGDNLRELPYAQLYSRLTTRSNSYTVYVRVQVLKKMTSDQNVWNEGTDLVQGDWRGSYEIERYLDPTAAAPSAGKALGPYKFRIVSAQQFAP